MIRLFVPEPGRGLAETDAIEGAVWVDLIDPEPDELARVAGACAMRLPERADMEEIELSSRLYHLDEADYLTLALPALTETEAHETAPVTFVLGERRLITVRYHAPRPFRTYPARSDRSPYGTGTAREVLYGILDEIVDRLADILEASDRRIAAAQQGLFDESAAGDPAAMRALVAGLGRAGSLVSDVRNSVLTIERAVNFLGRAREGKEARRTDRALRVLGADAQSLGEHAAFLTQKLGLLMDAAFGLTTIQQNAQTKVFSVVAVLFMPPTLIGTVWGMNFALMPGLDWRWGFPVALVAMGLSSALSYWYFRRRRLL